MCTQIHKHFNQLVCAGMEVMFKYSLIERVKWPTSRERNLGSHPKVFPDPLLAALKLMAASQFLGPIWWHSLQMQQGHSWEPIWDEFLETGCKCHVERVLGDPGTAPKFGTSLENLGQWIALTEREDIKLDKVPWWKRVLYTVISLLNHVFQRLFVSFVFFGWNMGVRGRQEIIQLLFFLQTLSWFQWYQECIFQIYWADTFWKHNACLLLFFWTDHAIYNWEKMITWSVKRNRFTLFYLYLSWDHTL